MSDMPKPEWVGCDYGVDDGPAGAPTCADVFWSMRQRIEKLEAALREIEQMDRWAVPPFGAIAVARAALEEART